MSDSFSRITSMIDSAKEFTIETAVSASARLTDTPSGSRPQEISKLLNSRTDREILNGMKCVISLITREEDALPYFADVVKNITNSDPKIRQLVIIYLTKYAEVEPDTALLSINSIQKSLNDKDPINRANAIRSLAGIRIGSIIPILVLSMKRTSTDRSPLVRAATAISIGKIYQISGRSKRQMIEYLSKLLTDSEVMVVGAAIKTYAKIRMELNEEKRWTPIHGNFRRFCKLLNQFDEWTQSYVVELLTEYSRKFLLRPINDEITDDDLELFLRSMKPLVQSISESVILSVAKSIYLLAPRQLFCDFQLDLVLTRIATSLNQLDISLFALEVVSFISKSDKLFESYYKSFYVTPSDLNDVAICKINILSALSNQENFKYIFEELKYYAIYSTNKSISKESIKAMGKCSGLSLEWSQKILKWCLKKIKTSRGETLNELLTVVRYLIQQKSDSNDSLNKAEVLKTTFNLAAILEDSLVELETEARASIIWIIGEYTALAENSFAPDVLRNLLKQFAEEEEEVRYQILVLASKIFAYEMIKIKNEGGDQFKDYVEEKFSNSIEYKMFQHALHLAKYDSSYDTRDRARMFSVLLSSVDRAQLASLFLQVPKPVPFVKSDAADYLRLRAIDDYFEVCDWSDQDKLPPKSIRTEFTVQVNKLGNVSFTSSSTSREKTKSPSPVGEHSFSSQQFAQQRELLSQVEKKQTLKYKLQSLDEFFGSEDDYSSSSSSEEEEEEEVSEEVESDEDEDEDEDEEIREETNKEA